MLTLILFHYLQEAQKSDAQQPFNVSAMAVPNVTMAKGGGGAGGNFGSGSSLSMVMERSKLEFVMPTPPQQAPKLDDGGSGGDDGKHNHNGGGGGDGDGGDDDDYFGGEGDGEGDGQGGSGGGGDGFFRTALPELYDRLTIAAVLQEWYKTVVELPLFIRRAVEMGLFSSAQLVRFLSMDVRPNVVRSVSRTLPSEVSQPGCLGWVCSCAASPCSAAVQRQIVACSWATLAAGQPLLLGLVGALHVSSAYVAAKHTSMCRPVRAAVNIITITLLIIHSVPADGSSVDDAQGDDVETATERQVVPCQVVLSAGRFVVGQAYPCTRVACSSGHA